MENTYVRASPLISRVTLRCISTPPFWRAAARRVSTEKEQVTYIRIPAETLPFATCIWKLWHSRNYDNWRLPWERQIIFVYPYNLYAVRNSDAIQCATAYAPIPTLPLSRVITPTNTWEFSWAVIPENRKWSLTVTIAFNVHNFSARNATYFLKFYYSQFLKILFSHSLNNALCSNCNCIRSDKQANLEYATSFMSD